MHLSLLATGLVAITVVVHAAGFALVLTLGLVAALGQMADRQYDDALMAQADEAPTQVVVIKSTRLPRV